MRRSLVAVAAGLLAAALPAQQLVQSQNDNPSYGSYAVGWPASVIGFRFTAAAPVVVAAQVFTGNATPATHSVEIRTRNATTGLPDQLVGAAGAWTTTHTRCFQGAVFAQPATLTVGQDYFLVWRVQGMFPQHSVSADTEPGNVPVETRVSDGNVWHAVAQLPGKFRLFGPYGAGTTSDFGIGKPGEYGVPTIGLQGWPARASPIDVWLDSAARNVLAVLVVGVPLSPGVPLGFCELYATPDILVAAVTRMHVSPLNGGISQTLMVPDTPFVVGYAAAFQWLVFDPAAADGISHTAAALAIIQ